VYPGVTGDWGVVGWLEPPARGVQSRVALRVCPLVIAATSDMLVRGLRPERMRAEREWCVCVWEKETYRKGGLSPVSRADDAGDTRVSLFIRRRGGGGGSFGGGVFFFLLFGGR
jgi:hypothetical protein